MLVPTWLQLAMKIRPKRFQDTPKRLNLAPTTAQEPPKRHPRRPKNRPRGVQEAAQRCLGATCPKAAQEALRSPPYLDVGPFWQRFSLIFAPFWQRFLHWFLTKFAIFFVRFRMHFFGQGSRLVRCLGWFVSHVVSKFEWCLIKFQQIKRQSAVAGSQLCCALDKLS